MWKDILERGRQTTIWHMPITCWLPKATNTRSEYVILISFPMQKCLQDSALMLRFSTLPFLFITDIRTEFDHNIVTSAKRIIISRLNSVDDWGREDSVRVTERVATEIKLIIKINSNLKLKFFKLYWLYFCLPTDFHFKTLYGRVH